MLAMTPSKYFLLFRSSWAAKVALVAADEGYGRRTESSTPEPAARIASPQPPPQPTNRKSFWRTYVDTGDDGARHERNKHSKWRSHGFRRYGMHNITCL